MQRIFSISGNGKFSVGKPEEKAGQESEGGGEEDIAGEESWWG
jgi:hypothetical protein